MSIRRMAALLPLLTLLQADFVSAAPIEEQMRALEKIRGLNFLGGVRTVTIPRTDLPARLREQFMKTLPYSTQEWEMVMRSLHLVDAPADDLMAPMLDLFQSQVLAFYDPYTRTYYAVRELPEVAQGLGPAGVLEESVAIHELMHALQDQQFAIGKKDFELRADTDANLAYHALLEGEATLVMLAHLAGKSGGSLDDIIGNDFLLSTLAAAGASDALMGGSTPRYFREILKFPYLEGLRFVVEAYRRGGWAEVDRIHANPPKSTREVLHPEEYFERRFKPEKFDDKPPSWVKPSVIEHLGEFHWGFAAGRENARGWLSDRVMIAQDAACQPTVLVETRWESPEAAQRFLEGYSKFLEDRNVATLTAIDGARVKVAYGADRKLMERFLE